MGRRYYCDYCDRSFIDDVESRKKHLNSANHARNRKAHYAANRDLITLIEEESKKDECKRFRNTGYCPFEDLCNFTHYSKEELKALSSEVEKRKHSSKPELPSLEDWLKKRNKTENVNEARTNIAPSLLQSYSVMMLPPSLRPVLIEHMRNIEFETWG